MGAARFNVEEVFLLAVEKDPADRPAFLDSTCVGNKVRTRVEALLRAHDTAGAFLQGPAVQIAPRATRPAAHAAHAALDSPVAGTVSGIADASTLQTHGDAPPSRSLPDELTKMLAPPERPDEIGRLGPYRILAVLGQGGMGVVYRAHDPALDRLVALKAMLPSMAAVPTARERFLREAKAAAALKHAHVVTIYQVGEDRGIPFLAMEFLEGESLDDRVKRRGRLPLDEALRIGREIAVGLAVAHARGLVHRDIKPANLWLEAPTGHVKVLDFGLAQAPADQARLTQFGMIVGTPAHMAPEQAEGKPVDARCDLFSLGCVLYQISTGTLPFHGPSTIAVLRALALHEPPPLRELRPDAPLELSALVARLLAKKPENRPASAQEVAETLRGLEQRTLEQLPTTQVLPKPGARLARNSRKPLVAVAGAALMVTLALILVLWPTPRGTVRIESDDPAVEVVFDKDGPTITGADKEPIKLRAGEHGIRIQRGDFTFEADKLVLKKGAALTLKVELLKGKVQVMQDGKVVASQDMPLPPPPLAKAPFNAQQARDRQKVSAKTGSVVSGSSKKYAPGAPDRPVKVFILAGDSNMAGRATAALLKYQANQSETKQRFQHLHHDGEWVMREDVWIKYFKRKGDLTVGFGQESDRFGPELEFGHVVGDYFDEQVLLIKTCWGGNTLSRDLRSPSSGLPPQEVLEQLRKELQKFKADATLADVERTYGALYREMLQEIRQTLANLGEYFSGYRGQGYEIAGFVYFSGWNDMLEANPFYAEQLANFIRDVRVDLKAPKLPFVIGQLGVEPDGVQPGSNDGNFRLAQAAVASLPEFKGNVKLVETDPFWDREAHAVLKKGVEKHKDEWDKVGSDAGYHYLGSAKTFCAIGKAFGEAIIELRRVAKN